MVTIRLQCDHAVFAGTTIRFNTVLRLRPRTHTHTGTDKHICTYIKLAGLHAEFSKI